MPPTIGSLPALRIEPLRFAQTHGTDCWDLEYNKVIRHYHGHLSAVFALSLHPILDILITGGRDSVARVWDMRTKQQIHVLGGHNNAVSSLISSGVDPQNTPINALAVNEDGVLVSGGDNGSINFWDYETGYCFQKSNTIVQPGSLDAEAGIYAAAFDLSGSRLITCEADKTLKIWKENPLANEDVEPIDMAGWTKQCLALKRY
eukprot:gene18439-18714_t